MRKAIALISGGLDSILAAKVIKEQEIEVQGIYFDISFARRKKILLDSSLKPVEEMAKNLGIDFQSVDIADDFLKLLKNPKHGFGSNMNPCIDCKILMLKKAKQIMLKTGASFIVTGEVVGQRPMSQHRQALNKIEKESGLEGLLLRPLSAKLLEPTLSEKEGLVDRKKLFNFSGRGRKEQIELAKKFKIEKYPNAGGGCLLTEPEFTNRLKDLISLGGLNTDNIELLKIGRHFRISDKARLIVGRNELENQLLFKLAKDRDYFFMPCSVMGPGALAKGDLNSDLIKFSCSIVCRYCDLNGSNNADIVYKNGSGKEEVLNVSLIKDAELEKIRI